MISSRLLQSGAALLALCQSSAPSPPPGRASGAIPEGRNMQVVAAAVELILAPKVDLGTPVAITLRLRNDGKGPIDLELPGRPVAFDITILRPDGSQVWRRLARGVVSSALMLVRLAPGETRDFKVQWDQVDNAGRLVGPGRYTVRGLLPTDRGGLTTPPRDLLIKSNP